MHVGTLLQLLMRRARLQRHERWSRAELERYQAERLAALRAFALARSPFYAVLHRGYGDAPLSALPIVTKAQLMNSFDDVVTDRAISLGDIERYIATGSAAKYAGHYRVAQTGGTTGRRGIFIADEGEWATVLASYARANDWAGVPAGLTHRLRLAVVSSLDPSHQSNLVGASLRSSLIPTLRLDAGAPLSTTARALDEFAPGLLVGYASILHELAAEQRAGRMRLRPRSVMSASEVLTPDMRAAIESAFHAPVFDVYAATETAGIASECGQHRMHLYEDLVIVESVDSGGQAVRPGERGERLLVTVLFNKTQPLIRYELSDSVILAGEKCPDGMPFALLASVSGRSEDTLTLAGVRVYPNAFHNALDSLSLGGWQVVERDGALEVRAIDPDAAVSNEQIGARITTELEAIGAHGVRVSVHHVDDIERTALGKQPLIRHEAAA
jgi:phenylacetate-CoA ligase